MIDQGRRRKNEEARQKVRSRIQKRIDTENYEFIPAKKQIDYYDNDVAQRVAV
jgi:site-specific DNA recombinase